ncbi:unnamed protein product [Symbiodinium sp. KB8]|nr:unnamed protein product [Symbiodinium sp. KB8]
MVDAILRLPFPVTEAQPAFVSKEQYSQVIELAASLTPKQRSKQKFTLLMPSGQKLTLRGDALNPRFIFRVEGSTVMCLAEEFTGISLRLMVARIQANRTGNHTSRPRRIRVPTAPGGTSECSLSFFLSNALEADRTCAARPGGRCHPTNSEEGCFMMPLKRRALVLLAWQNVRCARLLEALAGLVALVLLPTILLGVISSLYSPALGALVLLFYAIVCDQVMPTLRETFTDQNREERQRQLGELTLGELAQLLRRSWSSPPVLPLGSSGLAMLPLRSLMDAERAEEGPKFKIIMASSMEPDAVTREVPVDLAWWNQLSAQERDLFVRGVRAGFRPRGAAAAFSSLGVVWGFLLLPWSRDRFAGLVFQLVGSLLAGFASVGCAAAGQQSSTDSEEPQACKRPFKKPAMLDIGWVPGVAVFLSPVLRPLEKATKDTSSSEVDSDEFFYDQTPRPPKVLKKPATKAKSKPVKGG